MEKEKLINMDLSKIKQLEELKSQRDVLMNSFFAMQKAKEEQCDILLSLIKPNNEEIAVDIALNGDGKENVLEVALASLKGQISAIESHIRELFNEMQTGDDSSLHLRGLSPMEASCIRQERMNH